MQPKKDRYTFPVQERIKSSLTIKSLLDEKRSCMAFPIKCYYREVEGNTTSQLAVIVSKRRFKRAVDRNRIKRLMRESYRLQKHVLPQKENSTLQMCWIFVGKDLPEWQEVLSAGKKIFNKLQPDKKIEHENSLESLL